MADMRSQFSLAPVATALASRLGDCFVGLADDCVGPDVDRRVDGMQDGQVLLLENTRFHAEDLDNSEAFAAQLAATADVFVNDAFGVIHRDQASVTGITRHVHLALMGPLVRHEIQRLLEAVHKPQRPFVVILGGAKVVDKIGIIRVLLQKADKLLIGGKMAFTFLKANDVSVGDTEIEAGGKYLEVAQEMQSIAAARGIPLLLPVDQVTAKSLTAGVATQIVPLDTTCCTPEKPCIRDGFQGGDIGPATQRLFADALAGAGTVFWNGPLGKFEVPEFAEGTFAVAHSMAASTARGAVTVVGGGDSVAAVHKIGLGDRHFTHLSTGGGASLEFIQNPDLPGIHALMHAKDRGVL
ncbi:hypothetical protein WJX72_005375 [[Myrmecia] bisecta]|uniref:Phosphoglycerate kinase n=1 Tax=[Myrmecia] bisecta TaxID=41462 RepID=A0AAW1R6D8_9CHLO